MASKLVESVERIIVEALARQQEWADGQLRYDATEPDSEDVTRNVILAVADELEQANMTWQAVKWLRAQAGEE